MRQHAFTVAAIAVMASLAACQGSDPQPLELLSRDTLLNTGVIGGGGASAVIGYAFEEYPPGSTVRLVEHDVARPDQLVLLGDVILGPGFAVSRLVVADQLAVAVVGDKAMLIDLSNPSLPVTSISSSGLIDDIAVGGRWVLILSGSDLVLLDRNSPAAPTTYASPAAPTGVLATQGVFLVFTTSGYVRVDPSGASPTFVAVADPELGNVRSAWADGTEAVVAGPASAAGRSRVMRLDLTTPFSPVVLRRHEVPGSYVSFAWDGGGTSVVAVHFDSDYPGSSRSGYVVRESADGFQSAGIPLPTWYSGGQHLAAHAGHLLAMDSGGMLFFRIR